MDVEGRFDRLGAATRRYSSSAGGSAGRRPRGRLVAISRSWWPARRSSMRGAGSPCVTRSCTPSATSGASGGERVERARHLVGPVVGEGRGFHAAREAGEQLASGLLLQGADLGGHGRLGEAEERGRAGERAGAVDGEEGPQQVQIDVRRDPFPAGEGHGLESALLGPSNGGRSQRRTVAVPVGRAVGAEGRTAYAERATRDWNTLVAPPGSVPGVLLRRHCLPSPSTGTFSVRGGTTPLSPAAPLLPVPLPAAPSWFIDESS